MTVKFCSISAFRSILFLFSQPSVRKESFLGSDLDSGLRSFVVILSLSGSPCRLCYFQVVR